MVCVCAIAAGCAATRKDAAFVHDSTKGSVYLEQQPKNVLHANHPARIDGALVARVLSGFRVEEDRIFEDMGIGRGRRRPFSDDDVSFLTPLIVEALSRANQDQMVGFRVMQPTGDGFKTTEGVLWVETPTLHVALTKYQVDVARRSMVYRDAQGPHDATGLKWRVVTFIPEGLAETTARPDLPIVASHYLRTLVIDYDRLAKLPADAKRVRPAAPAAEVKRQRPAPPATTQPHPAAPAPAPAEVEPEPSAPAPAPAVETKPAPPAPQQPRPDPRNQRQPPAPSRLGPRLRRRQGRSRRPKRSSGGRTARSRP